MPFDKFNSRLVYHMNININRFSNNGIQTGFIKHISNLYIVGEQGTSLISNTRILFELIINSQKIFSIIFEPMKQNDPLGNALEDYLNGNTSGKIIVKSSIAEDSGIPVDYLFRSEANMPELEKKALQLCYGNVLDVGAAAGCHALILKNNGLNVQPIDISEKAIQVMKNRGLKSARQADYFELKNEKYDTLLFLMNGIGICGELTNLGDFFRKAMDLLKPDGQILLDSSDIIYMFEVEDGSVEIDLNAGYYGEVEYQMQYGACNGEKFHWLFIDFETLNTYATRNGFSCELILEGEHFDYLARLKKV